LDIGKTEVVCCVRMPSPVGSGRRLHQVRTFTTMTRSSQVMGDWLAGLGATRVVMEATSDYWKPPFYLLEAAGPTTPRSTDPGQSTFVPYISPSGSAINSIRAPSGSRKYTDAPLSSW
jgi:hypothetical protein